MRVGRVTERELKALEDSVTRTTPTMSRSAQDISKVIERMKQLGQAMDDEGAAHIWIHFPLEAEFSPNAVKEIIKIRLHDVYNGFKGANWTIFLTGPPGVGKSAAVYEAATEFVEKINEIRKKNRIKLVNLNNTNDRRLVLSEINKCLDERVEDEVKCLNDLADKYFVFYDARLAEMEPADIYGLPHALKPGLKEAEYLPPEWVKPFLYLPGILFLDELTNAPPHMKSLAYKLILDKAAGAFKFNNRVLVVAAGNLPVHVKEGETSEYIASTIPTPLVNRMQVIHVGAPLLNDWYTWTMKDLEIAFGDDKERLEDSIKTLDIIYSLLSANPDYFAGIEYVKARNVEFAENIPTPRSWTELARNTPFSLLKTLLDATEKCVERSGVYCRDFVKAYVAGFVGSDAAGEFSAMLRLIGLDHGVFTQTLLREPEKIAAILSSIYERARKTTNSDKIARERTVSALYSLLNSAVYRKIYDSINTLYDEVYKGVKDTWRAIPAHDRALGRITSQDVLNNAVKPLVSWLVKLCAGLRDARNIVEVDIGQLNSAIENFIDLSLKKVMNIRRGEPLYAEIVASISSKLNSIKPSLFDNLREVYAGRMWADDAEKNTLSALEQYRDVVSQGRQRVFSERGERHGRTGTR